MEGTEHPSEASIRDERVLDVSGNRLMCIQICEHTTNESMVQEQVVDVKRQPMKYENGSNPSEQAADESE
jgi:hypothetical protein